jgi:dihydropteroate synthase
MGGRPWKIAGDIFDLSRRGMIMGVLNVTPDSFSDGGRFFSVEKAVAQGMRMTAEGAQIIDVGGESTRPGAEPVPVAEELQRVVPVIEKLTLGINAQPAFTRLRRGRRPTPNCSSQDCGAAGAQRPTRKEKDERPRFISIDTCKAEVAEAALDAGASIVNDVTGGQGDRRMMKLIAERDAAFIVMHMQGTPRTMQKAPHYDDVVSEVADFFRQQYERALECGVDPMAIAFDPGIGFGKTLVHNLELLKNLERLRVKDRPFVVGVSRKSFLGRLAGAPDMADRLAPGVALTALLRARGAEVLRVHDVKENVAALQAAEAILEC